MHKFLCLCLALIMCLSLCACGNNNPDPSYPEELSKYEELFRYLEMDDYESAIAFIQNYFGMNGGADTVPPLDGEPDSGIGDDSDPGTDDVFSDWLPRLCGDWERIPWEESSGVENVTFFENGTVTIGADTYTWKLSYCYEYSLCVAIYDGDEAAGSFELFLGSNDFYGEITLEDENAERTPLFKPALYEIISITPENYLDYFSFEQEIGFGENAFGEATWCYIDTCLQLKDAFYAQLSSVLTQDHNGALEYSYEDGLRQVIIDLNERTCTFGEFTSYGTCTAIVQGGYNNSTDYLGFSLNIAHAYERQIQDREVYMYTNFGVVRMAILPDMNKEIDNIKSGTNHPAPFSRLQKSHYIKTATLPKSCERHSLLSHCLENILLRYPVCSQRRIFSMALVLYRQKMTNPNGLVIFENSDLF